MNFQRNIFVYWETPIQQAPLSVKVSYEKLQYVTKRDGWKLHLINATNIKNYLPDYDHFQNIVKKGHRKTVHEKSDILRIYLIEEHGGVWLDFSSVLFQSLDWLSDDELFDHLIINKVGTNTDDPDMLIIGEGYHQSPYSYYNSDNRLVCEEYFGTAIHFFAAKRKSPIMKAWKAKYEDIVTKSYKDMQPEIILKRFYLKNIYRDGVYLSGNIAFEQVIQEKQYELDNNIQLLNPFYSRQNVYQHFKIWQVHGEVGPIAITRHDRLWIVELFSKTKEEIEKRLGKLWFYMKINGYWRWQVEGYQNHAEKYFREHPEQTIEKILQKGPTDEECKLFLIVKGSVLHMLYENTKYMNEIKTPFITIEQREAMTNVCKDKNPEMYNYKSYPLWAIGQVTKAERQIEYADNVTMAQKISLIPKVYVREIDLLKQRWVEGFAAIVFYLTFRNLIHFLKRFINFIKGKIMGIDSETKLPVAQIVDSLKEEKLKAKIQLLWREKIKSILKWVGFSSLGVGLLFAKGLAYIINQQFFEEFDWNGYMGHWTKLTVVIGFNVILDWVIGLFLKHKTVNTFVSMQTILKETRVLMYLPLGYVAVLHMYIHFGFAHHHTMNFVAGGMLLYTWLEEVKQRKVGLSFLYKIQWILSHGKWAFLTLFMVYRLSRNIRYIRFNEVYLKEYLADFAYEGFWALLYITTAVTAIDYVYKLFWIDCAKNEKEGQAQCEKNQREVKRANIYHCALMLLIIWLIVTKTSEIYESKIKNPYNFNFLTLFNILFGLYMAFASMIRLRCQTRFFTIYGILLAIMSSVPILYWYYGEYLQEWLDWRPFIKKQCPSLLMLMFIIVEQFRKQPIYEERDTKKHVVQQNQTKFQEIDSLAEFDQKDDTQRKIYQ